MLFEACVKHKVLCQVVVLHPFVNQGLIRDQIAFFDLDGKIMNSMGITVCSVCTDIVFFCFCFFFELPQQV